MKPTEFLKASGSGTMISVEASPSASRTEVTGINKWRGSLQIRIAARPHGGAANEELIEFISSKLSIGKSEVRIVKGEKSSHKLVFVPLPIDKVKLLLGGA